MKLRRGTPRLAAGVLAGCVIVGGGSWAATAAVTGSSAFGPAAIAAAPAAAVTELAITRAPTRTAYVIGSALDVTGLVVTGTTDSGQRVLEPSEYTLSGFDSDTPGEKTVTVSSKADPRIRTTFAAQVADVQVPSPNLLANGSFQSGTVEAWTEDYAVGSAEVVTGSRTNGVSRENGQDGNAGYSFWDRNAKTKATLSQTIADLPRGYYTVSGHGAGNTGDAHSRIAVPELEWSADFGLAGGGAWQQQSHTFHWDGGDLTVAFSVEMLKNGGWAAFDNFSLVRVAPDENVTGIAVFPAKKDYVVGDELDLAGTSVRKVMDDDTTFALDASAWTASGFDGQATGTQTITVTLTADPRMVATYDVTVREREAQAGDITSMKIASPPFRALYKQGRAIETAGLRIIGADASGATRALAGDEYGLTGFDPAAPGTQIVTASLRTDPAVTADFEVTVVASPAEGVYRLKDLGAASGDGVVSIRDGAVVVDLSKVPAGTGTVVVESSALTAPITSLRFTPASGDLLDLRIADAAFAQHGEPTLQSVVFPDGLDTLTIGATAFFQYSADGSAALAEVVFPRDLIKLELGDGAFRQDVRDAATLRTVSFPQNLRELTVGAQAFRQKYGTQGGLESVNLPGGLDRVDLGLQAFSVNPSYRAGQPLRAVHLGFSAPGKISETRLAEELTRAGSPLHPDASRWLWMGADSTVQAVFGPGLTAPAALASASVGQGHALRFDDGTAAAAAAARGVPSDLGFVPMAGEPTVWEQSVPTAVPEREGYAFLGWSADPAATAADIAPGDRVTLTDTGARGMTLHAVWQASDDGGGDGGGAGGGDGSGGGSGGDGGSGDGGSGDGGSSGSGASNGESGGANDADDATGSLAATGYAAGGLGLAGLLALAAGLFMKLRAARSARSNELG